MEVILKQDVSRLGKAGSVVKVKDGFARNFLLPSGLAVLCNSDNLKRMEEEKAKKLILMEKLKTEAEGLKGKLNNLSLTIPVLVQEDEKLYGSITAVEIAASLNDEGFQIDKNSIALEEPIKSLGVYEVSIKLHPEVTAKPKIWIVKK